MIFYNSSAPTGWTQKTNATNFNDRALRVVTATSGTGGTKAGNESFSDVFSNQSVSGNVTGTSGSKTAGGSISGNTANHALTANQIPSHFHYVFRNQNGGQLQNQSNLTSNTFAAWGTGAGNKYETYNITRVNNTPNVGRSSSVGSGGNHNHGSGNLSFSGSSHNHGDGSYAFSTSLDLRIKYLNMILCQKD